VLQGAWGPGFVTDYIVDEVLSYAAARLGREAGLRLGELLLEKRVLRILPVTLDLVLEAWGIYRSHLPRLSFTDATTVAAARLYCIDYIATVDGYLAGLYPSLSPHNSR
jgi:predicted nucleic acid-binding protein